MYISRVYARVRIRDREEAVNKDPMFAGSVEPLLLARQSFIVGQSAPFNGESFAPE